MVELWLDDWLQKLGSPELAPQVLPKALRKLLKQARHASDKEPSDHFTGHELAALLLDVWEERCRPTQLPKEPREEYAERWLDVLIPRWQYLKPGLLSERNKRLDVVRSLTDLKKVQEIVEDLQVAKLVVREAALLLTSDGRAIRDTTYNRHRQAGVQVLQQAVEDLSETEINPHAGKRRRILSEQSVLLSVPFIPRLRIQRHQQQEVVSALIQDRYHGIVVHGGAGMGKTTLVGQVLRLPEVQAAFPGGIAWASGTDSTEEVAKSWCKALDLRPIDKETWKTCWRRHCGCLEKTLLVLDDVSQLSGFGELVAGLDAKNALMITTRFWTDVRDELTKTLGNGDFVHSVHVDGLTPSEAQALVEQARGDSLTDEEWDWVECIGVKTGWDPVYMSRVAVQSGVAEWRKMLRELEASGRLPQSSDLAAWLSLLAKHMLAPRAFSHRYAAVAWDLENPETAKDRLVQLEQAGLVQRVEHLYAVKEEMYWQIAPRKLLDIWKAPTSRLQKWRIKIRYLHLHRKITCIDRTCLPGLFNILGLLWNFLIGPAYLVGVLFQRGSNEQTQRQQEIVEHASVMEDVISLHASDWFLALTILPVASVCFIGILYALLLVLPLSPVQKTRIADVLSFKPATAIVFVVLPALIWLNAVPWPLD